MDGALDLRWGTPNLRMSRRLIEIICIRRKKAGLNPEFEPSGRPSRLKYPMPALGN